MSNPIRLYAKQSAVPKTCGSCALFTREQNDPNYLDQAPTRGTCGLAFPPWMKLLHTHARRGDDYGRCRSEEVVENSSDWTMVQDVDTCSFWRPSGLTFVKDQTWSATDDGQAAPRAGETAKPALT
jgi:hypothetical protein